MSHSNMQFIKMTCMITNINLVWKIWNANPPIILTVKPQAAGVIDDKCDYGAVPPGSLMTLYRRKEYEHHLQYRYYHWNRITQNVMKINSLVVNHEYVFYDWPDRGLGEGAWPAAMHPEAPIEFQR